ncbi:helix-turn-helix domain-containing protein [Mycolicibacterium chlorophenolicum]|uniref:winged helix-turn-helix domain-containing protein n=1 Tax=Mycolicibacterium chlorophenolicum TaxID=37916 RepID=UPI001F312119|nr:helix-turn-helix domain-containing protein [Mycolicibacterium chlorophenolicum]
MSQASGRSAPGVRASNLRRKLGDDPVLRRYVRTVRGLGYCLGGLRQRHRRDGGVALAPGPSSSSPLRVQVSMMRTTYGVIPDIRTGEILMGTPVCCASSI